jgi:isopenicillin-N epimerase
VFLNHGSFGAVPRAVFEEQERLRREMEAEPVLFLAPALDGRLADVRAEVAALVGVADLDAIALVPNRRRR